MSNLNKVTGEVVKKHFKESFKEGFFVFISYKGFPFIILFTFIFNNLFTLSNIIDFLPLVLFLNMFFSFCFVLSGVLLFFLIFSKHKKYEKYILNTSYVKEILIYGMYKEFKSFLLFFKKEYVVIAFIFGFGFFNLYQNIIEGNNIIRLPIDWGAPLGITITSLFMYAVASYWVNNSFSAVGSLRTVNNYDFFGISFLSYNLFSPNRVGYDKNILVYINQYLFYFLNERQMSKNNIIEIFLPYMLIVLFAITSFMSLVFMVLPFLFVVTFLADVIGISYEDYSTEIKYIVGLLVSGYVSTVLYLFFFKNCIYCFKKMIKVKEEKEEVVKGSSLSNA